MAVDAKSALTIVTTLPRIDVDETTDPVSSLPSYSPSFFLQQGLPTSTLDRTALVRHVYKLF